MSVTVSWNPPLLENQNGVIRKYIINAVELDTGNEYTWESITTSIDIHSLHPYYTYQFTASAYTVEQGPFSFIVTVQMPTDGKILSCSFIMYTCVCISIVVPSAPPLNVTIESVLSRSLSISWQPPADKDRNGIITQYTISYLNLEEVDTYIINTTEIENTVTDLTPFTTYEVKVAAHTSAGRGPFSVVQTLQTQESGIAL